MTRFLQCLALWILFTTLLAIAIFLLPLTLAWRLSCKGSQMKQCFFFIYRMKSGRVRWDRPIGGLVMRPKRICGDVAVADLGLAEEIASHRYHCAPDEQLVLAEVVEEIDQRRAVRLHRKYEQDMSEFLELMGVGE